MGNKDILMFDPESAHVFESSKEAFDEAVKKVAYSLAGETMISSNYFLDQVREQFGIKGSFFSEAPSPSNIFADRAFDELQRSELENYFLDFTSGFEKAFVDQMKCMQAYTKTNNWRRRHGYPMRRKAGSN